MRELDDKALLRLVAVEQRDYRPEAIAIAHAELGRRGLTIPTRDDSWNRFPSERIGPDGFCAGCRAATTDESPGDIGTMSPVGIRLIRYHDVCPACGAVAQRKWVCLGVPIIPLSKYRIIYIQSNPLFSRFIGRKLRDKRET
jgi:hypothetical protein